MTHIAQVREAHTRHQELLAQAAEYARVAALAADRKVSAEAGYGALERLGAAARAYVAASVAAARKGAA